MSGLVLTVEERAAFADRIRDELYAHGRCFVAYEPGDATHYEFVLIRLGGFPVAAQGHGRYDIYVRAMTEPDRYLMADGALCYNAMTVDLSLGHFIHPEYVREKWGVTEHSAAVIAELLNMITRCHLVDAMREQYPYVFGAVNA